MVLSFKRSADALFALSFLVCTLVALFATFLYFIERGSWDANLETFINSDGQPSSFDSIPAAAWWVLFFDFSHVSHLTISAQVCLGHHLDSRLRRGDAYDDDRKADNAPPAHLRLASHRLAFVCPRQELLYW